MRENRTSGSVRGVPGNWRSYREIHKILISPKRKEIGKREKDLMSAQSIGELCLTYDHHRNRLNEIFNTMPQKWQRIAMDIVKERSPDLFSFFQSNL